MKDVQMLRKVPPVNSEVLVHWKNIESPVHVFYNLGQLDLSSLQKAPNI
jgi:hypothetical protein